MELRVSSAAIKSTSSKVRNTRNVISSKLPMGVAHKYNFPCMVRILLKNFYLFII